MSCLVLENANGQTRGQGDLQGEVLTCLIVEVTRRLTLANGETPLESSRAAGTPSDWI
jgi:hypothetical protein